MLSAEEPGSGNRPVLVSRRIDGWLVGWLAVLVWVGAFANTHLGVTFGWNVALAVYWVGAVVSAAHFGLSYHLAYRGGTAALRQRPAVLLLVPAALILVLAVVVGTAFAAGVDSTRAMTSALITFVYLATTWHYVKQAYGVGRVGAAFGGHKLATWDVRILRYGLYPLWFVGAAQMLVQGVGYNLAGFRVGYSLLPMGTVGVLRLLALCCAVPIIAVLLRLRAQTGRWPSPILVATYAAAFLWLGLPPDPVLTLLLLAPFHALQYLAIGHRAEVATATVRPAGRHGVFWWLNIFAGAACGGLLLIRWLPQLLDAHLRAGPGAPLLFASAFFVFLNLHHYLIDASIWRSKGDLVKALVRPPAAAPVAPVLTDASCVGATVETG